MQFLPRALAEVGGMEPSFPSRPQVNLQEHGPGYNPIRASYRPNPAGLEHVAMKEGDEVTAVRFNIDQAGKVNNINQLDKPIVKAQNP